jgi:hypothetical protein
LLASAVGTGVWAGLCVPCGVILTIATVLRSTRVLNSAAVTHVTYGYPFRWVTQDQTIYPLSRYPGVSTVCSPRRCPTQLNLSSLTTDAAIWSGLVLACFLVIYLVCVGIRAAFRVSLRSSRMS